MRERFQMYRPKKRMGIDYSVNSLSGPTGEQIDEWEYRQEVKRRMKELIEKVKKAEQVMAELGEAIDRMIEYGAPDYEIDEMIDAYHKWEQYCHELEEYFYDLGGGR